MSFAADTLVIKHHQMVVYAFPQPVISKTRELVGVPDHSELHQTAVGLIAAGDGLHASAQDVGDAVCHQQRVAPVGDQTGQVLGNADAPLGRRQQRDPLIGGDAAAVKRRNHFRAADRWKPEWQGRIVGRRVWLGAFAWTEWLRHPTFKHDQCLTPHPLENPSHALNNMG